MNKPKLLFILPGVLIFVLSVFISCKADVEEPEVHANEESTESQVTYYTVTYYSDSSFCKLPDELKDGFSVEDGSCLTESFLPTLSSEYAEFKGWYSDSNYHNKVKEGDIVTSNLRLRAKWDPYQFDIVYNCNGGVLCSNAPSTYSCGTTLDLGKITAEHKSYDFDGWYESEDFSTPKITRVRLCSRIGKLTLYAKWVKVSAANIGKKIENMTESGIIFAGGDYSAFNSDTYNITWKLSCLYGKDSSIRVILDLTDVTGWNKIPSVYNEKGEYVPGKGFNEVYNLTEIRLPKEMKEIGHCAFRNCNNLTRVILPEGLEVLDEACFMECKNLKSLTIPNSVTKIPGCAFLESGLTTLTIPSSITYIGYAAFSGCTDLKHVVFVDKESIWYSSYLGKIGVMNDPFTNATLLTEKYKSYDLHNDKYSGN